MNTSEKKAQLERGRDPVILERSTYRRRRLIDAMRLLPVLGLGLWVVPLLWNAQSRETLMSHAVLYVFGVWLFLVVAAAIMAVTVTRRNTDGDEYESDGSVTRL